jgi:hypothetical protein
VFATVLRICPEAGLIRLVVLHGTKVTASASLEANRSAATIDEQVRRMVAEAESTYQSKDCQFGPGVWEGLARALSRHEDRLARLAAAAADAGFWSEENAASARRRNTRCSSPRARIARRGELREAASPRGRMPKGLSVHQRPQRSLRTKRGRTISAKRGESVEPVFGRMKHSQGAGQSSMRGLGACRGAWHGHAAVHALETLHRTSIRRRAAGGWMDDQQKNRA